MLEAILTMFAGSLYFQVMVSDGTTGCPSNTSLINITIIDANDNAPVFTTGTRESIVLVKL